MNKRTPLRGNSISRAAPAWLAGFAVFLGAVCSTPAFSQTETVVAQGRTDVCYESRDMAIRLARMDATNDANRACRALGIGWSYSGIQFSGYEQCFSCKSAGVRCAVTQAIHICTNPQKEREEKAAKARAEKEAADQAARAKADEIAAKLRVEKAAKERAEKEAAAKARAAQIAQKEREEKAARERAATEAAAKADRAEQIARKQREEAVAKQRADKEAASKAANAAAEQAARNKARAAERNSIDDAFAKMEKQIGKAPSVKADNIDAGFEKLAAYRAEQERLRIAALKAQQDKEARELKLRMQREQSCNIAMNTISACYAKTTCKSPAATPSVEQCNGIPRYPDGGGPTLVLSQVLRPGDVCYREDAECRAARAERRAEERREAEALHARQERWNSRYGALRDQCQERSKERSVFATCQKQYAPTCNPKGFESISDCLRN